MSMYAYMYNLISKSLTSQPQNKKLIDKKEKKIKEWKNIKTSTHIIAQIVLKWFKFFFQSYIHTEIEMTEDCPLKIRVRI